MLHMVEALYKGTCPSTTATLKPMLCYMSCALYCTVLLVAIPACAPLEGVRSPILFKHAHSSSNSIMGGRVQHWGRVSNMSTVFLKCLQNRKKCFCSGLFKAQSSVMNIIVNWVQSSYAIFPDNHWSGWNGKVFQCTQVTSLSLESFILAWKNTG